MNVAKDNDMYLHPHEKLQLHMDCLNALGEIVTVEDVDDMGGVVSEPFSSKLVHIFI